MSDNRFWGKIEIRLIARLCVSTTTTTAQGSGIELVIVCAATNREVSSFPVVAAFCGAHFVEMASTQLVSEAWFGRSCLLKQQDGLGGHDDRWSVSLSERRIKDQDLLARAHSCVHAVRLRRSQRDAARRASRLGQHCLCEPGAVDALADSLDAEKAASVAVIG